MELFQDFKDLLKLLNAHKVEYIIVGGYALAFHGAPRYTGDIDLYVKPESENAARIISALNEFGFASLGLTKKDFEKLDQVIQLGFPPIRIDLITSISGVSWEEVFKGSLQGKLGNINVKFIGLNEFIANKKSIGRNKDLADIEALGK